MDMKTLRDKIESLDPGVHGALKQALTAEYERLSGHGTEPGSQKQSQPELLDEMFKKAANALGERYIPGTSDYVRKHHADLYRRTEEADERLDAVWQACRKGSVTAEEFRGALRKWYGLHLEQIEIYARERSWVEPKAGAAMGGIHHVGETEGIASVLRR